MFNNLTNLAYKRTTKEAMGFYIAYLVGTILVAAVVSGAATFFVVMDEIKGFEFGLEIGSIMAVVISVLVTFFILKEKKMLGNFGYLLLVLVAGILSVLLGGLAGLIPAAYLTTKGAITTTPPIEPIPTPVQ